MYLNLDFDDGLPALDLGVALSQAGESGAIVVFRNQAPVEGSSASLSPPPGVSLPPGISGLPEK